MRGRLLRGILLSLLLALGLCLAPLGGSNALYLQPMTAANLTNAAHHQEQDSSSGKPVCALVRCECHACPHLAVTAPSKSAVRSDLRSRWPQDDSVVVGVILEVMPPPPRTADVEMD